MAYGTETYGGAPYGAESTSGSSNASINLVGVVGAGSAGIFTVVTGTQINLVGVAGTGSPGTFALIISSTLTLTGVSGIGSPGNFTVNIPLTGVTIVVIAPYLSTDVIGAKTFQIYDIESGVLTAVGTAVTTGFTAIPNITNGWWVAIQVTPNGAFGDFAGIAVFGNINGSDARAIELYSPPSSTPSSIIIDKVAPYQPSDTIVTPGYQLYDKTGAAFGGHVTSAILAIPGVTNGRVTKLTLTPDARSGVQYGILWDGG